MRLFPLLIGLCVGAAVNAQRYFFENISVTQDLPSSKVYAVLQDSTGLVWVGTESGLASYDGTHVIAFDDKQGMAGGGVRSLFLDDQKRLWCGHLGGGITIREGRDFRSITVADKPLTADVTGIAQDAKGAIWLATVGMGALRVKELTAQGTLTVEHFAEGNGPGERISGIARRKNGDLVFIEAGIGLHVWNAEQGRFADFPEKALADQPHITSYFEDASGGLWVGTQADGAFRFDPKSKATTVYHQTTGMPGNFIYAFGEDAEGRVWISCWEHGLVRVEKDGLRLFDKENGPHSESIRSIVRDREGNLLIATTDEGLDVFKGDRFRSFGTDDGLVEPHVWAVAETRDGRMWFGTNLGITVLDPAGSGPLSVREISGLHGDNLTSSVIRCLLVDQNGHLWVGTENGGVMKIDPAGGAPVPLSKVNDLLPFNKVTALARSGRGGIYVGSVSGLFRSPDPASVPIQLNKADGLAGDGITTLFTDSKGATWVGSASSGVSLIPANGAEKATRVDLGSVVTPTSFTEDAAGRIWVGTLSHGIFVLENGKVVIKYDQAASGLLSNNIRSLVTDENGHVWIGTTKGLNERKKDGTAFLAYTGRSGFTGIEAYAGAICRTHTGDLWFGTANGAVHVVVDHGEPRTEAPLIAVRVLKVNFEERDAIDGVDLSHTERDIRIEYGCVSLSDQEAVRYQFMLEGLQKDWEPITAETEAKYPGLSPGHYTFMVKARNRSGIWSEPVRYHFTVLPPWYKTWWFYTITAVLVGFSTWTYIKFRERQLRLRNLVLEQKVEERTAEVVAQSKEIEGQKVQIEDLLLNILPKEISDELKEKGKATARRHDAVTVMFTDMKGFTKVAEKMTPEELVNELDECFIKFDEIIGRYGIEKIKTIGDSYMCAGGVPTRDPHHADKAVLAALEVRDLMSRWKRDREAKGKEPWVLRIGVHTGPVVAGVVGKRKFAYDIWGDTVNTASRMESSGEPGEVNVSGATYQIIKDRFDCVHRGQVEAKNKGRIDMYFVMRIKPEFSADAEGGTPNERFRKLCGLTEPLQQFA